MEPLGLPKGSIRAIITLIVVVASVIALLVTGQLPVELGTILTMAVGYYFGTRASSLEASL